jgi:riboflavin biosynthesis pyrimidine reductase
MLGSVDGRIKQNIWGFKDHHKYFEVPASKIKADAWLVGRTTMQEFSSKKTHTLTKLKGDVTKQDFVAPQVSKTYAVVIDPSGKCFWDTKDSLDLALVLKKLYKLFGIKRIRIDGGGHVNGSFLKAGLIDEFSLVLAPLADGTIGAPTIFEAEAGYGRRKATHFKLKSVKKIFNDFLWIRYQVVKNKKSRY